MHLVCIIVVVLCTCMFFVVVCFLHGMDFLWGILFSVKIAHSMHLEWICVWH